MVLLALLVPAALHLSVAPLYLLLLRLYEALSVPDACISFSHSTYMKRGSRNPSHWTRWVTHGLTDYDYILLSGGMIFHFIIWKVAVMVYFNVMSQNLLAVKD